MADGRLFGRINLTTSELDGPIGPLPDAVATWGDGQVLGFPDLDPIFGLDGIGFWRATVSIPDFDPDTQAITSEIVNPVLDPETRTIAAEYGVRDLTPEEIEARTPPSAPAPVVLPMSLVAMATMALDQDGNVSKSDADGIGGMFEFMPGVCGVFLAAEIEGVYLIEVSAHGLLADYSDQDMTGFTVTFTDPATGELKRPAGNIVTKVYQR